jgi:ribosomal-protein-alanine N-acetyltransferase
VNAQAKIPTGKLSSPTPSRTDATRRDARAYNGVMIADDIELLSLRSSDLVAVAQCHALYATVFPSAAFPAVGGPLPAVWVAKRDARVVGFIATRRSGRRTMEVHAIAVDTAHHGAGIGRALLREAIGAARAQHLSAVSLQVSTGNLSACALYASLGFRVTGKLPRYYSSQHFPNDGDAQQMTLSLSGEAG